MFRNQKNTWLCWEKSFVSLSLIQLHLNFILLKESYCSSKTDALLVITQSEIQIQTSTASNRFTGGTEGRICFSRLKDRFKTNRKSKIKTRSEDLHV